MKALLKLAMLFALGMGIGALSAQTIYVYPSTVTAPRGGYQTCTAIVTGVNNKAVTWSTTGGTLVGTNPSTANEPATIALHSTTAGTYTVTATSGSATGTCVITLTASPTPVATHPRLLVTSAMLPSLQAKAVGTNALFVALKTNATNAFATDNSVWSWTCNSGTGLPSSDQTGNALTEQDANLYAFMALVDPSDPTYNWGCYAHDMWVYLTVQMVAESAPVSSDRIRYSGKAFAYTTDWLLGSGLLNSTEQAESATFLHYLGKQVFSNVQGGTPPVTGYNSSTQFNTGSDTALELQYSMGNNYMEGKFLIGAALGITFNDSTGEDPTLTNCAGGRYAVCPDYSANSLRAYWNYWTGAYLYKQYAHLEDPNVSWIAYQAAYSNLPTQPVCNSTYSGTPPVPCFGTGRGGGPAEGNGYGYSVYSVRNAMNIIHTAGMDDPLLYGPQMSLVTSSWWELNENMELTYLAGLYGAAPQHWAYFSTGDTNSYYRYPFFFTQLASDLVFNSYFGRSRSDLLWPILNTAQNGLSNFMTYDLVNSYGQFLAVDLFIALPAGNPTTSPPSDPRPSQPLDRYDPGQQDLFARTGWTTSDTTFTADCNPSLTTHDHMYCGRYEVFSKGEYITKGQVVFDDDYNYAMADSTNSNLVSIMNNPTSTQCTLANGCTYWISPQFGGQYYQAGQAGPSTLNHSELPAYVAFNTDQTNAYNGTSDSSHVSTYNGVDAASRSLVWIRAANQTIYYDRGSTTTNAWDKALYTITTGTPTITGNTASWSTRSATQKAYLTSLLPAGATISNIGLDSTDRGPVQAQDWEPSSRVKIDAGNTTSSRFLTVLEWGASGFTPSSPTLNQSSAGQGYDCAFTVGETTMACFMRTWPAGFTGTTIHALGATHFYFSDMSPNTTYTISASGAPATGTTDNAGVLTFTSDGTGDVVLSTGGTLTAATPTFLPVAGTYAGTQSVVLSSTTAGATLCYTTDGSTPTANGAGICTHGTTYSTAVSVASSLTLKAIASESGFLDSSVGSAAYTITSPASLPTISGGLIINGGFTIQ